MTDQPPSISELLARREFLERLALSLTGERAGADDLVQETWLKAIERPPRHGANLTAWLERVMRNLHYRRKERDALLKATELDPVLTADDGSAEELAEQSEVSRQIAEATQRLEEPYRSVVLLRFYEGKTPTQIAAHLGRPINTVTSQLARGLQRIGTELDKQHEGDRSLWSRALLPLALRGKRREANAPLGTSDGMSRSSFPKLAFGAGALLATGLLAVLSFVALSERPSSHEDPETLAAAPSLERMPAAELPATKERREPIAVAPEPTPPSPDPATELSSEFPGLELEVVDTSGAPIPGARIDVTRASAVQAGEDLATQEGKYRITVWTEKARTDAQGRARIVPTPDDAVALQTLPGSFLGLVVRKPGFVRSPSHYLEYPLSARAPIRVTLETPTLTVRGRVTDAEGEPVLAKVFIGDEGGWNDEDGMWRARRFMGILTDQQGRYVYDDLPPGVHRVVILSNGFLPLQERVEGTRTIARDFVLERGASLIGSVVTKDGQPVAEALISAEYTPRRLRPVAQRITADAEGVFVLTGLARGLVRVLAQHPSDASLSASVFLQFSGTEQQEWSPELDRHPPLRLRIVTDEGQPVAQAGVRIYDALRGEDWHKTFSADDEGVVSAAGLPVTSYMADVFRSEMEIFTGSLPCFAARKVTVGEAENVLVVARLLLEQGSVTGRIVAAPDQPLVSPQVYLLPLEGRAASSAPVDPETGTFFKPIPPQSYQVTLYVERLGVVPLGVIEVRPNETHDMGEIFVPVLGAVDVDWRWTGEESQYIYKLTQYTEMAQGGPLVQRWDVRAGQGRLSESVQVLPGRFEWTVSRQGKQVEFLELEVQPGSVFPLTTGVQDTER